MRRTKQRSGVVAGILLPMGLICLFAFCSLALALLGGKAYKNIQGNVDKSYSGTVAASYLRTKLGQNNAAGNITLKEGDGTQVLVIATVIQEREFETRIFMHEGKLVETFGSASQPLDATAGNTIATLKSCDFEIADDGLFTASFENAEGEVTRTAFALTEGGHL